MVHGDLYAGGNILLSADVNVRLTDVGMSLISKAASNYSFQHGGGAICWSSPELFDREEFG